MIAQMAIAIALQGFNDLGRSVTPIFLLMDYSLYWFSTFSEKMKKIYRLEVWIPAKCTIEFFSFSSFFLTINPVDHAELLVPIFQNQGSFPQALSLKQSRWPPFFFCIVDTSNSLSDCSKNFKEIYQLENFHANVLK